MPYMYGAIHIVDGSEDNQWWEKPFVVSKRRFGGTEVVYGTVTRKLERISSQVRKLQRFSLEAGEKLKSEGIAPTVQGGSVLPVSEVADRIIDEQDDLIEDVLLTISVNIRILSELFPRKLKRRKVRVYDYDDGEAGEVELSEIADLLLHNRYLVIKGDYVVDLLSDEKFLTEKPQMGLKIDFQAYLSEVEKVLTGLSVRDLIGKLWGMTKALSTSSSVKDIVFLTQNLYTLGDSVVRNPSPITGGPLKTILDRVARNYIDRMYPKDSSPSDVSLYTKIVFATPRFYIEPDLDHKEIRTEVQVNGSAEKLVMPYEEFFEEVSKASGDARLYNEPGR